MRLVGMQGRQGMLMSHFETTAGPGRPRNKKEVKTGSFSPPGVVGCCMTILSAAQQPCQRRLANPNAALRNGQDRGDFGKWPGKEPHPQRETESTSDAQKSGEQNVTALHGSAQQPAQNQPPGTAPKGADRVTKLREPAPETDGAAAEKRSAQCHGKAEKNRRANNASKEHRF